MPLTLSTEAQNRLVANSHLIIVTAAVLPSRKLEPALLRDARIHTFFMKKNKKIFDFLFNTLFLLSISLAVCHSICMIQMCDTNV